MGVGKTIQALFSLDLSYRAIIVSPTQVIYNWFKEIQFWRPEYKIYITKTKKDFRLPEPGEIVLVSYHMLPEWVSPPKGKRKVDIPKDILEQFKKCYLIFDEFHRAANSKSKLSRNSKYLSRLCYKSIGLTGTPIRNKPYDLWTLLNILGIEKIVFRDFFHFLKSYSGKKGPFGWYFPKNPKVSSEISESLKKVMLRRLKEDVIEDLPDEIYIPIYLSDENIKQELDSSWALLKNLKGFSEGKIPDFTEMSKVKATVAKNNIPKMLEIVEEYEESEIPLIVASDHVDPILALQERSGWKIIIGGQDPKKKFEAVESFQKGELKGIGVSLKAGSEGINLFYGNHILFNDRHWTPSVNEQFIDRVNRIGQKQKKIFIKDIIPDHPLTQHIYEQNIKKMILSEHSIEHNEGLSLLKTEKKKSFDEKTNEVIYSCVPEWESRFSDYDEENISDEMENFLKIYKFSNSSAQSIISLLTKIGFEDKQILSLAKKVIKFDKVSNQILSQ